jgi:apolipoprotein N-acyltransferase
LKFSDTPLPNIRRQFFTALVLGVVATPGFLPVGEWCAWIAYPASCLPILASSGLIALWQRAPGGQAAFMLGFAFGLGLFGGGIYWIIIALTTFGGMAIGVAIFVMAVLIAYLSLYPALVGYIAVRFFDGTKRLFVFPALWGFSELLRGWLLSGFPWLSLGYAQALPSPLAGYIPLGGVYFAGVISMVISVCLVSMLSRNNLKIIAGATVIAVIHIVGFWLTQIEWTYPTEKSLAVSLIQGNVPQNIKFDLAFRDETYTRYRKWTEQSQGRLVVLPESAFPDFADMVPDEEVVALREMGVKRNTDFLVGMFTRRFDPDKAREEYFNSVVSIGASQTQLYRKRHLVLFGEKIPLEDWIAPIMNALIAIPLAGQSSGDDQQPPFAVAGERVGISICFEDAFGAEQIERARASTLLANFTNDAWYGRSIAAWQHHRIASMRALESGRPLLRATNTGITSIINHRGQVVARLPWFEEGILEGEVTGRSGNTPYLRWGDWLAFYFLLTLLLIALIGRKRRE